MDEEKETKNKISIETVIGFVGINHKPNYSLETQENLCFQPTFVHNTSRI